VDLLDDKQLETRLKKLKTTYNDMPARSNADKITKAIIKYKAKTKSFHFSYVASLIGVGMIAGVLIAGIFQQSQAPLDSPNDEPKKQEISPENKAQERNYEYKTFEELEDYFNKKVEDTTKRLGYDGFAASDLVLNVSDSLQKSKYRVVQENYTEDQLLEEIASKKDEIDYFLTAPSVYLDEMKKNKKEGIQNEMFSSYMEQLERYLPLVQNEMVKIFSLQPIHNLVETVELLNSGEFKGNTEAIRFAKKMRENGYMFTASGEGMLELEIDYDWIALEVKSYDLDDGKVYLEVKQAEPILTDGYLVTEWNQLGDYLVANEKAVNQLKESVLKEQLKKDFRKYYRIFLLGSDHSNITDEKHYVKNDVKAAWEKVIGQYGDTQTGKEIRKYFQKLENNKFLVDINVTTEEIHWPPFADFDRAQGNEKGAVVEEPILPLSSELQQVYEDFKMNKEDSYLKGLTPFQVMSLYFHCDSIGDYETKYALVHNHPLSKEEFVKEEHASLNSINNVLEGYMYARYFIADHKIRAIELFYNDGKESRLFGMNEVNGVWKVKPFPFQ
jgi:hypothetical protein